MPGQLKPDAKCLVCGRDAAVIFRTYRWIGFEVCDVEVMHAGDNEEHHHCRRTVRGEEMAQWNDANHVAAAVTL